MQCGTPNFGMILLKKWKQKEWKRWKSGCKNASAVYITADIKYSAWSVEVSATNIVLQKITYSVSSTEAQDYKSWIFLVSD